MENTLFMKGENQRKSHNTSILSKMKKGEPLAKMNTMMTWYPPRPVLKKNKHAIHKLYGMLGSSFAPSFDLPSRKSKLLWFKKSS